MKAVNRVSNTCIAFLCALIVVLGFGASPSSATEADKIDHESVREMHAALRDLRAEGLDIEGDISEEAIIEQYYGEASSLEDMQSRAAPNGCSTPKQVKMLVKRWNKLFKPACDNHDRCHSKKSRKKVEL